MWLLDRYSNRAGIIISSFEVTATKPTRHYRPFCWIFKRESLYLPLRQFWVQQNHGLCRDSPFYTRLHSALLEYGCKYNEFELIKHIETVKSLRV